jgi:hypothetical protein
MVQGSLDQPPIVVRSSRSTSFLMLIISVAFVAAGVGILRDPHQNHAMGYLGIAFFGLGIPIFAWRLVRPDILTLAPDGITWRNALRTTHWQWSDVERFRAYSPSSRSSSKHVGFDFTDRYHAETRGLRQTTKAIAGVEGSLGGGWELGAADLSDLLNKAWIRWAGSPSRRRI